MVDWVFRDEEGWIKDCSGRGGECDWCSSGSGFCGIIGQCSVCGYEDCRRLGVGACVGMESKSNSNSFQVRWLLISIPVLGLLDTMLAGYEHGAVEWLIICPVYKTE